MHRRSTDCRERGLESAADGDAPRIPQLLPSRGAMADTRAAQGLLGLLASHADKQLPRLDQQELQRRRQQLPGSARPIMSLEAAASAMHPTLRQYKQQDVSEAKSAMAPPLVAFLGRQEKAGSPRLPDNVTSPRSVWEESPPNERLDPTASPRHIATSNRLIQTPPTTSSWRIHNLLSPEPTIGSQKRRTPPSAQSDVGESATKRPRLVRRVSSQWRQELSPRDRAKTRERIMRSLHQHCQGDFETLLLLLSTMEEELLHIKTTSSEFYFQQAFELSDLVEHATLER